MLLVGTARALVSLGCWWSGFRAISDDDYARVVIAQRFAAAPSLDPSGTSWLPLPFWLYGVPMAVFGDSLTTARAVALALGVASAMLVWLSGRLMGLSERAALLGALGAVLLPYGAWLSCATVPEAPTAALLLLGSVTLCRAEGWLRVLGGLALGAACFSRYEAWAPAAVFALLSGIEATRERRRVLWLAVGAAIGPIALWLMHGIARHGDALFFVARVRGYRAALGEQAASFGDALIRTPLALVRFEPELLAVVVVAAAIAARRRLSLFGPGAWRPLTALAALVVFLMAADLGGGAATHHPERSLLPVFWLLALVAAGLMTRLAEQPRASAWPLAALPLALAASLLLRPEIGSSFAERRDQERVGSLLRYLDARDVVIDTPDFGFFAVQAALGHGRSRPLSDHDPRKAPFSQPANAAELGERLRAQRAAWFVSARERAWLGDDVGQQRATVGAFSIFALNPAAHGAP